MLHPDEVEKAARWDLGSHLVVLLREIDRRRRADHKLTELDYD
jgi:hypothetical protein